MHEIYGHESVRENKREKEVEKEKVSISTGRCYDGIIISWMRIIQTC